MKSNGGFRNGPTAERAGERESDLTYLRIHGRKSRQRL